jgi:Fe-S cluster assembly scaffold protein SufB
MQKKLLAELAEEFVTTIQTERGLTEGEARAMVVIALKANRAAIIEAIKTPSLVLSEAKAVQS